MKFSQFKNAGWLFSGQIVIKLANFLKQILLAFFLGVSADIDLLLVAQIVPAILSSMIAGGAGEVLVTGMKKKEEFNPGLVVIFTFVIAILTLIIIGFYLLSLPVWLKIFNILTDRAALFWALSLVVVFNKLPVALVSTLTPMLFFRNKYRYYIFTSLASELAGILFILLMVKSMGILAFAWGLLITSTVNALLFFNIHGLSVKYLVQIKYWQQEWHGLRNLLFRVFSLSLQTLVNHISTFWERTLSMRFLAPGYLSALNYSKSLTEMPKMIMLSSILTTTFIEQVKHKTDSDESFVHYSRKMEGLLSQLALGFQILSIVFAPLILILFFRRGKFDNQAVEETLIIYQLLTIGFVPGLMMNFFIRTVYIFGHFRNLLFIILGKFVIEVSIMLLFIQKIPQAIPLALVLGKFCTSILLFWYIERQNPGIFNRKRFAVIYSIALVITISLLFVNQSILPLILTKSTLQLILLYLPVAIVLLLMFIWYLFYSGWMDRLKAVLAKSKI